MRPAVKISLFICVAAVLITFMILAYKAGYFGVIVENVFNVCKEVVS